MDLKGEYRIPASREQVWAALNDPKVLKACIPGCETLEKTADNAFAATVAMKVGPVRAKFSGAVELSDIDPPNGYTISGEGKGGAAGFAKGGAKVSLAEDGDETVLSYDVEANVGGKLAQLGSRLIDGTARKMADDFFARFSEQAAAYATPTAAPTAPAAPEPPVEAAPAPAAPPSEEEAEPAAATEVPPKVVKQSFQTGDAAPEMLHTRPDDSQSAGTPPPAAAGTDGSSGLPSWIWIAGVIVVVVVLLYAFSS